ncbi:hypothetical protein [Paraburkholderia sp. WC7.3d]|uniref:hypothetical protein n=1 Tax=Paraburkholderia sp. WC7.3d TaxID=2991069 RepID=UPI003D22DCFE
MPEWLPERAPEAGTGAGAADSVCGSADCGAITALFAMSERGAGGLTGCAGITLAPAARDVPVCGCDSTAPVTLRVTAPVTAGA